MLTTATVAALMALQTGSAELTAPRIVSNMLARYSRAESLSGTIRMTQTLMGRSVVIQTELQYVRPLQLNIRQTMVEPRSSRVAFIRSNGHQFAYSPPRTTAVEAPEGMIVEPQDERGVVRLMAEVYALANRSLFVRSTPLDIAIAGREDLRFISGQWVTVNMLGRVEVGGVTCWRIGGNWRAYAGTPVSGTYEMIISPQFDLVRFTRREMLAGGDVQTPQPCDTVYEVNLRVGVPVPASAFVIRR